MAKPGAAAAFGVDLDWAPSASPLDASPPATVPIDWCEAGGDEIDPEETA